MSTEELLAAENMLLRNQLAAAEVRHAAEVVELKAWIDMMAERIAKASEVLSNLAERRKPQ